MKYMGSKRKFAREILSIVLNGRTKNQWYVEPFCGGMNVICNVDGNRMANDINIYLIEMWRRILDGWIPFKITREEYNDIKKNMDKYPKHIVGWAGFNCSYSGKWFGGFAGETKTKIGTTRDYQQEAINNVMVQSKRMNGVVLCNLDYADLDIPKNSIIYCDPPYSGTTEYGFSFDHSRFWNWATEISNNGAIVFVSEYNAPDNFKCVWEKEATSSLSANGKCGSNKISVEKLFVHRSSFLKNANPLLKPYMSKAIQEAIAEL